jgi:hypothetical protein
MGTNESRKAVCGWQSARCNSAFGKVRSVTPKTSANTRVGTKKGSKYFISGIFAVLVLIF